jgi:hypothetical protein
MTSNKSIQVKRMNPALQDEYLKRNKIKLMLIKVGHEYNAI